ncbi:MAG: hypothetical protein KA052_01470 [Candidatus Pacebacteria bacterium]|nr:hypothetical protein [Candidatus Paceibacterota bacterium]
MAKKRILLIGTEFSGHLITHTFESLRRKIGRIIIANIITKVIAYRGPANEGGHLTLLTLLKNVLGRPDVKYNKIFNSLPATPESEAFISKRTVKTDAVATYKQAGYKEKVGDVCEFIHIITNEEGSELIVIIVDYMVLNGVYVSYNQITGDKENERILIPGDAIEFDCEKGEIVRNDARLKRRTQVLSKK